MHKFNSFYNKKCKISCTKNRAEIARRPNFYVKFYKIGKNKAIFPDLWEKQELTALKLYDNIINCVSMEEKSHALVFREKKRHFLAERHYTTGEANAQGQI